MRSFSIMPFALAPACRIIMGCCMWRGPFSVANQSEMRKLAVFHFTPSTIRASALRTIARS